MTQRFFRTAWYTAFIGCLSLMACQKSAPPAETEPLLYYRNLLTNHHWQICCQTIAPAVKLRNHPDPQTDLQAILPACKRDNILSFSMHGRWRLEEGATTCRPKRPTLITQGDWLLNGTPDSLGLQLVNREGDFYDYQILHLDSTVMVRRFEYNQAHVMYRITETLQISQ